MNILLITTDQHRADTLGAYGSRLGATPNLDALAGQGSLFETALTQHPYCQPARWTILTGQHPRTHGIWTNGVDPEEQQIADAFSTRIAREGHRTAFIGKAHFATSGVMVPGRSKYMEAMANAVSMPEHWQGPYMGFEHVDLIELGHYPAGYGPWPLGLHYGKWLAKDGRLKALERFARAGPWSALPPRRRGPQTWNCALPEELHPTTWTADRTIEALRRSKDKPFFIWCSFADPHHPFDPPAPWCYRYDAKDMTLPRRDPGEFAGKPAIQRKFSEGISSLTAPLNPAGAKISDRALAEVMAAYYGMVAQLDHNIGRVLGELATLGLEEETLVVFTSDHGELLGDHSMLLKGPFHYDGVVKVPLIVKGPKVPAGRRVDAPVGTIDLVPTFEQLLGSTPGARVEGESLLALLNGKAGRDAAVCENDHRIWFRTHVQTIVTREWKLNVHCGEPLGELYDRRNDPGEFENRWGDRPRIRAELSEELARRLPAWHEPRRRPVSILPA